VKTAPSSGSALINESFGWRSDGRMIASVTDNLDALRPVADILDRRAPRGKTAARRG
jgi:hypothetical protein